VTAPVPSEVKVIHSQLLRVTLEAEHAQAYWIHARPELSIEQEAALAFGEYWFGVKSMPRVRNLLGAFRTRYAAYPEALAALRAWSDIDRDFEVIEGDPIVYWWSKEFLARTRRRRSCVPGRLELYHPPQASIGQVGRVNSRRRLTARIVAVSEVLQHRVVDSTDEPQTLEPQRLASVGIRRHRTVAMHAAQTATACCRSHNGSGNS